MKKVEIIALVLLQLICFSLGVGAGKSYYGSVELCQRVVIQSITAHQKAEAELQQVISPDFLTALTRAK